MGYGTRHLLAEKEGAPVEPDDDEETPAAEYPEDDHAGNQGQSQ